MCLLKAAFGNDREIIVFDPNINNLSEEKVFECLQQVKPDLVGVTSVSTEYFSSTKLLTSIIRRALPESVIVFGGVIPTVLTEESMKDKNVDYWLAGEGEKSFPELIDELEKDLSNLTNISGLAYWKDNKSVLNKVEFIEDLDKIAFPDYSNIIGVKATEKSRLVTMGIFG